MGRGGLRAFDAPSESPRQCDSLSDFSSASASDEVLRGRKIERACDALAKIFLTFAIENFVVVTLVSATCEV